MDEFNFYCTTLYIEFLLPIFDNIYLGIGAFEEGSRYSVRNETQGIETVYEYVFRPEEDGTCIDRPCNVNAKGLKKAIVPAVVNIFKKEDGDHLQRLKLAMEG